MVANVNTMSPRSAVRIVAEALGFAPTEINALAKHVPRHGDAGPHPRVPGRRLAGAARLAAAGLRPAVAPTAR